MSRYRRGMTIMEMLVVLIIVGVLAAIALSRFGKSKDTALKREAFANLKLIQAAQRIYRMEVGSYYPVSGSAGTADINDYLRLSIVTGNAAWTYTTDDTGCSIATRTDSSGISYGYKMDNTGDPTLGGTCP